MANIIPLRKPFPIPNRLIENSVSEGDVLKNIIIKAARLKMPPIIISFDLLTPCAFRYEATAMMGIGNTVMMDIATDIRLVLPII